MITRKQRIAAVLIGVLIPVTIRFAWEKPRLTVNRCHTSLLFLRDGYRSLTVEYCDGFMINEDGSEMHLYRWPTYRYIDMRKFMELEVKK